jgi:hypothetical protein
MPSRQVSSESFNFSISLHDNIQKVGSRIILRSIHNKIKEVHTEPRSPESLTVIAEVFLLTRLWNTKAKANSYLHQIILKVNISLGIKGKQKLKPIVTSIKLF